MSAAGMFPGFFPYGATIPLAEPAHKPLNYDEKVKLFLRACGSSHSMQDFVDKITKEGIEICRVVG